MRRFYPFRWVRVISLRHPIPFFVILFLGLYLLHIAVTKIQIVNDVLTFIGTMVSTEYGTYRLHSQGRPLHEAALWIAFADTCNILLDLFVVYWLLHWRWSKFALDAFSRRGQAFIRDLKKLTRTIVPSSEGTSKNITRIKDHLNGYATNPHKVGKRVLFILGTLPRIPGLPGGVGIGILIIKYRKLGLAGWLSLFMGVILRHSLTLAVIYGAGMIFS